MMFWLLDKDENGPKRPYDRPKRAKMYEKKAKIEFLDLKKPAF